MYSEGEDKYLKDLDCVNIVKSIRELKALTRVILSQQQREILTFEHESLLPSNKAFEQQEANFICNKVPFEYAGYLKHEEYYNRVERFAKSFEGKLLSDLDIQIFQEIIDNSSIPKLGTSEPCEVAKPKAKIKIIDFNTVFYL